MTRGLHIYAHVSLSHSTPIRVAALCAVILLAHSPTRAQVITGIPPLASMTPSTFDTINNANLNIHSGIPIVSKPGRGIPFSYVLSYDSSVWLPVSSSGASVWTPVGQSSLMASDWGWRGVTEAEAGYATYQSTWAYCHNSQNMPYPVYSPFVYNDSVGTPHSFAITVSPGYPSFGCPATSSGSALATDGSGYYMTVTLTGSTASVTVSTPNGLEIPVPLFAPTAATTITDPNGNQISATVSSNTTTFKDTLNTTALTVTAPGGGASATYTYTGPAGSATFTVKYTPYTVQTYFGCTGISEFPATQEYLVSEIDLPDQATDPSDKYTFTYETTPQHSPNVTGRLASVTLPTGGTISYTYSGGQNGITCADGSTATLERYTPDTQSNYWNTRTRKSARHGPRL